jgi:hypothetical protein
MTLQGACRTPFDLVSELYLPPLDSQTKKGKQMPNWCSNNLYITVEDNKQLEKVIQGITNNSDQPFDFNRIIPIPEELQETSAPNNLNPDEMKAKYGFSDWYEWRVFNWGTKWNASDVELNLETPQQIHISFQTAWSPPLPVIEAISKQFPFTYITLDWEEEGGYYGKLEFEKGVVTSNYEGEIDCAYRWQTWGDCIPDCDDCGECDCEVCNCSKRTQQTLCNDCNDGQHNDEERKKEDEESQIEESSLSTTKESD